MSLKALVDNLVGLAFQVADDVPIDFTITANSSSTYDTVAGGVVTTGTPIVVPGIYYKQKTLRPTLRPIEGVTPEPPAITQPMGLIQTSLLNNVRLKIDDPVFVNGEKHRITEIDVDPTLSITILYLQVQ